MSASAALSAAAPNAGEAVLDDVKILPRADLLRHLQRALEAPYGVLAVAQLLVDGANEAQALDLAPPIATRRKVAKGGARLLLGTFVETANTERLGQIERRERDEFRVLL